ncbi:hypothetical protein CQW23_00771 [Capsicum baccatum]|uniref:Uncharacterized protein n=1 Tax=Capsicum baccatum TaxID=33114 RepID=A0A2G2XLP5_CAPBA|nr:hypothetical protein CQW23_00771 [Capsicum baccatum]
MHRSTRRVDGIDTIANTLCHVCVDSLELEAGRWVYNVMREKTHAFAGTNETQVFDEQRPSGNYYLAEVCSQWEAAALNVNKDARLALIRIVIVLEREGGALGSMLKFIKTKILDGCGLRHLDYDV